MGPKWTIRPFRLHVRNVLGLLRKPLSPVSGTLARLVHNRSVTTFSRQLLSAWKGRGRACTRTNAEDGAIGRRRGGIKMLDASVRRRLKTPQISKTNACLPPQCRRSSSWGQRDFTYEEPGSFASNSRFAEMQRSSTRLARKVRSVHHRVD